MLQQRSEVIGGAANGEAYGERSAPPMSSSCRVSTFAFQAADAAFIFVHRWLPQGAPKPVVQIAHGIAEHGWRYARLAGALTRAGYAVYANDHRGHGRTAPAP